MAAIDDLKTALTGLETAVAANTVLVEQLRTTSDETEIAAQTARVAAATNALTALVIPAPVAPPAPANDPAPPAFEPPPAG